MKKFYTIALILSTALAANGAKPFVKTHGHGHPITVEKPSFNRAPASTTLVNEDFSKFSDGSESAPGAEIVNEYGYSIDESLTAQPGWRGLGIHPAGGAIAITQHYDDYYEEYDDGFISTPAYNMGGTATLTFRAKKLNPTDRGNLWVVLCDDYYGPGQDDVDFTLTDQWQTYTLVATHGDFIEYSYFQFKPEGGSALIDDIRVDFVRDRLPAPYSSPAKNISSTEFVAQWEDNGSSEYILNVYRVEPPQEAVFGTIVEGFDGIKVAADGKTIDSTAPDYPEGWYINLSEGGSRDVTRDAGDFASAPQALVMDALTDTITTAVTPQPIDSLSFWVKPVGEDDEYGDLSLLKLEIYHSEKGTWENIAQLPYYWLNSEGGEYSVSGDYIGDDVTQVRLSIIQLGLVSFIIDDVTLHYSKKGTKNFIVKDHHLSDCQYTVKDIDPSYHHYYYVQSTDGEIVSEPSYTIWVDGVSGLQVQSAQASSVSPTGFTASWDALGHATQYSVNGYRWIDAQQDIDDVVVLEEDFDAIDEGTVDAPGSNWGATIDFASYNWASSAWRATNGAWAIGMAGTLGTTWYGAAGLIMSPALNLSGNAGQGFDVEATVVTTIDNIETTEGTESEGVFVITIASELDTQALTWALIETPQKGSTTARVTLPNPNNVDLSNIIVAFMNKSGTPFFVDKVKIIQDIKSGEELVVPFTSAKTAEAQYTFTGLDESVDHAFAVTAIASKGYDNYESESSDMVYVKTSTSGVEDVTSDTTAHIYAVGGSILVECDADTVVEVYSLSGCQVSTHTGSCTINLPTGMYIVKAGEKTAKIAI